MVLRIFWNVGAGLVHRAFNKSRMKPLLGVSYPAVWRARPGFLDCDINLHLNNASYLFNMELARWHFTSANGMMTQVVKKRRMFIVGSQAIRYRHAIPPFRPYEIHSQLVFADADWMYMLHQFLCPTSGKVYAEGLSRATCTQGRERVPAATLIAEVLEGESAEAITLPEEMPDVVKEFLQWDAATRVDMETATERAQREVETRMASTATLGDKPTGLKRFLANLTRSWNMPV